MASLNKIQIIGYLGKDPEARYFPSGDLFAVFSVAVTDKWTTKEGEQKSKTQWFNCQATRRLAEICRDYLHKGSLVYIEGKMESREYEDDQGVKKTFWEVKILSLQMLDRRGENGHAAPAGGMEVGEIPAEDDIPF